MGINFKKKINIYFILHILFLTLTVYTRRYYIFFFLYYFLFYFKYLNLKDFFITSVIILLLSIPGFLLILKFPYYLETTGYNYKFYNTIPIISSMFFFYILPFINYDLFKSENSKKELITFLSVIIFSTFIYFFDYNPKMGGGYFIKLSNIFFYNNYFFYVTAILGFYLLIKISSNNKENFFLISLIFLTFSNNYMLQKYFEPLWIIIIFLMFDLKSLLVFFKNNYQIFIVVIYFFIYLITAITNSIKLISINFFL